MTKTIHTDKVFTPDLSQSTMEAFPHYAPIPCQIRTIKSFNRPVILVDDIMHPGFRIKALDPILRKEEVDIRMVLVGLLSGHGRDLMDAQGRPVDSVYYLPRLREWFVESTLYPFIGGDTVRRRERPTEGLQPPLTAFCPTPPRNLPHCPGCGVAAEPVLSGKRKGHPAGAGGGVSLPLCPEPDAEPPQRGSDPAPVSR